MTYVQTVAAICRASHAIAILDEVIEDLAVNHAGEPGVEEEIRLQVEQRQRLKHAQNLNKQAIGWHTMD